jgi:hypothetical protein
MLRLFGGPWRALESNSSTQMKPTNSAQVSASGHKASARESSQHQVKSPNKHAGETKERRGDLSCSELVSGQRFHACGEKDIDPLARCFTDQCWQDRAGGRRSRVRIFIKLVQQLHRRQSDALARVPAALQPSIARGSRPTLASSSRSQLGFGFVVSRDDHLFSAHRILICDDPS